MYFLIILFVIISVILLIPGEKENKAKILRKTLSTGLKYFLSYLKYCFLTGAVLLMFVTIVFCIINITPDYVGGFLKYFSFIDSKYATDSFSMGGDDVMKMFSIISLAVMFVALLGKFMLKKFFKVELSIKLKTKVIGSLIVVTLLYLFAGVIIKLSNELYNGFYIIFIIFYIINVVSLLGFWVMESLLIKIFYKEVLSRKLKK